MLNASVEEDEKNSWESSCTDAAAAGTADGNSDAALTEC